MFALKSWYSIRCMKDGDSVEMEKYSRPIKYRVYVVSDGVRVWHMEDMTFNEASDMIDAIHGAIMDEYDGFNAGDWLNSQRGEI